MAWTMHRIHKWLAVSVSLFLFLWATSGIVMILPQPSTLPAGSLPRGVPDYRDVSVSPAQAVDRALQLVGRVAQVTSVNLKPMAGDIVYVIELRPGGTRLIDARQGTPVVIDARMAERISREGFPQQVRTRNVELVEQYTARYPGGPLPSYRVTFDDPAATESYVAVSDGTSRRSNRVSRFRTGFTSFHEFGAFRVIIASAEYRRQLMIWLNVIAVVAIITGWYLAVPRRRKQRP